MNWIQRIIKRYLGASKQPHKAETIHSISIDVEMDATAATEKIDALNTKAGALEATMRSVVSLIDAATEKANVEHLTCDDVRTILNGPPMLGTDTPRRAAPRPETVPEDSYTPEDYDPSGNDYNQYEFGPGIHNGAFVFCPDCGHAVQSGYSAFDNQTEADQYARKNCPECRERAKQERLETRKRFVRCLEILVRKAEPTVRRLEHIHPGGDGEAVVIHYSGTETTVPISASSLLCIAKSVFEALPY